MNIQETLSVWAKKAYDEFGQLDLAVMGNDDWCESFRKLREEYERIAATLTPSPAKDEQVREEYENKLDYYIGLLCDCYNAGELNPQLQHKIWEALHCVPDRKPLNVKNIKNG